LSVRAPGHASDHLPRMGSDAQKLMARVCVPDQELPVRRSQSQAFTFGPKRQAVDGPRSTQRVQDGARRGVPDADFTWTFILRVVMAIIAVPPGSTPDR